MMSSPIERVEQTYDEDALATAFLAGWMASGEGWNGEYPDREDMAPHLITVLFAEVLRQFDMWMLDVSASVGVSDE